MLAVLGLAALAGGMLFFGAVMAPLVFIKLPPAVAGPFIRAVFPWYYGYIMASAGVGAAGFFWLRQWVSTLALVAVMAVTFWLWFWLIPALDAMRIAGDVAGFTRGHRLSVWVNGAELVAALWLLVRAAV